MSDDEDEYGLGDLIPVCIGSLEAVLKIGSAITRHRTVLFLHLHA